MKKLLPYIVIVTILSGCQTKPGLPLTDSTATSSSSYTAPDDEAIKKAVDDAYASISFKKGDSVNFDQIKSYFTPKAQLTDFEHDTLKTISIDQFVYLYRTMIEGDSVKMYNEKEIYGKTEQFGRVASRLSTYRTYKDTMDKPIETGVNLFQLVKTSDGWKISSIEWDVEKDGVKVPGYYLPAK